MMARRKTRPRILPIRTAGTGAPSSSPCGMSLRIRCGKHLLVLRAQYVFLTHFSRDVPKLAKNPPLPTTTGEAPNPRYKQLRSFVFHRAAWKDYEHRMTKGERAHGTGKTGEGGEDRTWEFCIAPIRKQ